jgi:hypothetical protein
VKVRWRPHYAIGVAAVVADGRTNRRVALGDAEQFDLERGLWIIPPVMVKQLQQRLRLED